LEQVSEILAFANREGLSIIPWGGGTRQHLGNLPRSVDVVLGLARLNRLVEYEPADLTVTVEAGMPLQKLQSILAERGQFLPLDPPQTASSTIGGILAANATGPLRFSYGTARDFTIGIKVVHTDGTISKAGGKVVKNVAGYDLMKLYIGSLGTLAVLGEVTFKVYPRPELERTLVVQFPSLAKAVEAAYGILDAPGRPRFLELENPGVIAQFLKKDSAFALVVGLDGFREDVEWLKSEFEKIGLASQALRVELLDGKAQKTLREALRDLPRRRQLQWLCKASLLVSKVEEFFSVVARLEEKKGLRLFAHSHFGNGIVYVGAPALATSATPDCIAELRDAAEGAEGHLVVEVAPPEIKAKSAVWGNPGGDFALMKALKEKFDPKSILNPGRFVGRL